MGRAFLAVVVIAIVGLVVVTQALYTVDETNHAVVEQFGQIRAVESNPGLHFKLPFIQNVTYLDKRVLTLDTPSQQYLTSEEKRIEVDQVTRWKIDDPRRFFLTARTEALGQARLRPLVEAELRAQIAGHLYNTMISTERDAIMDLVKDGVRIRADENGLGISILDVRTKRADLPEAVERSVFDRMESARRIEADRHRATGQRNADRITAETDRAVAVMLACADRVSQEVRGDGDAAAIAIFAAALQQDPDFFSFLRRLEAYPQAFSDRDKLVLSTDSNFLRLLSGESVRIPDIEATTGPVTPLSDEVAAPLTQEEADTFILQCIPASIQESIP